ncbi:MAG TPA: AzlC family ABC transporter permease [Anaerolineales bacterium]
MEFPMLVGVLPFGLIYGATALRQGLTPGLAQSMSAIVFAGSAQFITSQLMHAVTPPFVIVLTIGIVNLRHMLYSASVAPFVKHLPLRWRVLLAYLLTDEAYAATIVHYESEGATPTGHWFFLGAGASLWFVWQVSTALGIFLGTTIPETWPLDFALPLTFIAMLVPTIKDRSVAAAALSAAAVALAGAALPYKLGLMLAALIGITVGMLVENRE